LTVAITASLLPLECHKLIREPTVTAVIAALINIAIVIVLIVRLQAGRRRQDLIANAATPYQQPNYLSNGMVVR